MDLPPGAMGCLRFVIVVFPDHTHYFCCIRCICPAEVSSEDTKKPADQNSDIY